ncbi:MAG: MG2 domain-containing protein [bacterium]
MKKYLIILLITFIASFVFSNNENILLKQILSGHYTYVLGQNKWITNSKISLRIVVKNFQQQLIKDAKIYIKIGNIKLFSGKTNKQGTIDAQFTLPKDLKGKQELTIKTITSNKIDEIKKDITIEEQYKILLTTDKPIYQPNQIIHIRILSLNSFDLKPLKNKEIIVEIEDPKGNKVFKQKFINSLFGICDTKFQLADEINLGTYTIRAILNETKQEKKINIDKYVLPKFKIHFNPEKNFYAPEQELKAIIEANYFFGKPVSNAKIIISLSKFDINFEEFALIEGNLNDSGIYELKYKLPSYFVGQPLEQGKSLINVKINIIDTANHKEAISSNIPISSEPLCITAIPESGSLVANIKNNLYILTTYPDHQAASTEITIDNTKLKTNNLGITKYSVFPKKSPFKIMILAQDDKGNKTKKEFQFSFEQKEESILLQTNQAVYKVGENLIADIFTSQKTGTVYLDIIKNKQTILTQSLEIQNGKANLNFVLSNDFFGTLELHSYIIPPSGNIIRDTKIIFVNPKNDLEIKISTDKDIYLPAEEAILNFEIKNKKNKGILAALGITVVDESVFALQEMQPGLEKIYFMLEKEIMTPRYEIHNFTLQEITKPLIKEDQLEATKMLLSSFENLNEFTLEINSYKEKIEKIKKYLHSLVEKDAEIFLNAIETHYQKYPKVNLQKFGIKQLIKKGLLKAKNLKDPWGNKYNFILPANQYSLYDFNLISIGPDGIKNSIDDITCNLYDFIKIQKEMPQNFSRGIKAISVNISEKKTETALSKEPVKIRQHFPETLFVEPNLITDDKGFATLKIPLADSITTWRLSAIGSSLKGELGSISKEIRVFQEFFIDIDAPVQLTQGDVVSIPVAIYNYLPDTQQIKILLEKQEWFDLQDTSEKNLTLKANEVSVVYFSLKIKEIGWQKLTVFGYGNKKNDAITRQIEIIPNGQEIEKVINNKLEKDIEQTINIPDNAIDKASNILVKIYPNTFSQIIEGLDKIFRMPFGCFEQTSSVTYPNILVLDYIKKSKMITPELQMKAEQFINLGYQRLLSFEVSGNGFSWFGNAPANQILTAYGLMEFNDMKNVHNIDEEVIKRTQNWLLDKQQADGSWIPDKEYLHSDIWQKIQNSNLLVTSYILWGLLESGLKNDKIEKAVNYLKNNLKENDDAYILGLCANAMVVYNKDNKFTLEILKKLDKKKKEENNIVYWTSDISTITYSKNKTAHLETTSLITYALLKSQKYPETINKALAFLIQEKDSNGTWYSTQATVLVLKSLILSLEGSKQNINAKIKILANNQEVTNFDINSENSNILRLVSLKKYVKKGDNQIKITFTGQGSTFYQIVNKFYLPWEIKKETKEIIKIDLKYDKTTLIKDDIITCQIEIKNMIHGIAKMIIADLGIPPAFTILSEDLTKLVQNKVFNKFNLTDRQIIIYIEELNNTKPIIFSYRLKAKYPIKAKTPKSKIYKYYEPEIENIVEPIEIEVK